MRKDYELEATCGNEFVDDLFMRVTINDHLAARILELATAVIKLGVYQISEFNYFPEWYERDINDDCDEIPSNVVSCDICMLVVTAYAAKWKMHRKHLDSPIYHTSEQIPIDELMKDFDISSL